MEIKRFGVRDLLPDTMHYMTYDGSTTMPACHETTTWIILNKPIYITKQQVGNGSSTYLRFVSPLLPRRLVPLAVPPFLTLLRRWNWTKST